MGGQKQNPQEADYTPAQEPIALTAGARGRMSSLLTILALLLILWHLPGAGADQPVSGFGGDGSGAAGLRRRWHTHTQCQ